MGIVTSTMAGAACTHRSAQDSSQIEDEDDGGALTDGEFSEGAKLIHPSKATAYATRVL